MDKEYLFDNDISSEIDDFEEQYLNCSYIEREFDNDLLNHALHYVKLGYPVFPLHNIVKRSGIDICSCRNGDDCTKQGKHPRTRFGHKEATIDEDKIIDWWEKYPNANIGLLTGIESGIIVLDVDVKDGGQYSLADLEDYYKQSLGIKNDFYDSISGTLTTKTGSGGNHYFFKYPLDFEIKGSVSKIGQGLDIRANGNYIVAPPSNHISGNKYQWIGTDSQIKDAPKWLIYEILKANELGFKPGSTELKPSSKKVTEKIKDGEGRYEFFWKFLCGLVRSFTKDEVLRRALEKNQEILEPPYPKEKVIYQVDYLFKRFGKMKTS